MMADDVSENRASHTKDPGTLLLRPGQIQGHTKSNQCLGSVSLCVQHASAFLWEPFLPFGQCCVLYCYAGNLCGEMVAWKDSGGGDEDGENWEDDDVEKTGGTWEAECCPDLLGWSVEAGRAAKSRHVTQCSRPKAFPDMLNIYSLTKETSQRKKQCFLSWTWNCALAIMYWNCFRLSWMPLIKMMKSRIISLTWWIVATIVWISVLDELKFRTSVLKTWQSSTWGM